MEIGQIEAFDKIVTEGSFSRAAEALSITQPSISARIALLEAELGGNLFERDGRTLRLTALGQTLLPYAERVLAGVSEGRAAVKDYLAGKRGQVSMAAMDMLATSFLIDPIERFRAEYPAVDLMVIIRIPRELTDTLHEGRAQVGFTRGPIWDKQYKIHAQFREPVRAIASRTHPLALRQAGGDALHISDIYDHTLYRVTQSPMVTAFVETLAETARRGSGGALIFLSPLMALPLIRRGRGLAFLAESVAQADIERDELVYLDFADAPPLYNEFCLVSLANKPIDLPNQEFMRMIIERWEHLKV
jgi:LysR family transcriptional regulator, low CO2-responsive transcriptional regulator